MTNKNTIQPIAVLCALLLSNAPAFAQEPTENPTNLLRRIDISGDSNLEVTPDEATFSVGVQTIDKDSDTAMKENAKTSDAILSTLKNAGIEETQITTTGIRLSMIYKDNSFSLFGKPDEYRAENTMNVTVTDLATLPELLGNLAQTGANDIGGLNFDISNRDEQEDEAMLLAVDDAHSRAEKIAQRMGMKLGDPIQVRFGQTDFPVPVVMEAAMDRATMSSKASEYAVSVSPGTILLQSHVEIQYELVSAP